MRRRRRPSRRGVTDKIVRVLYDCTDEHNKAFNHAAYENMLYAAGVFWVQEITPQKITITVDRRSMDADGTPEGNLTDYLAEKEYTPERIGELVELARPLIAEATEKATQERHTGLFVPVEIEVKNYRNYREEKFSFEGIRFCTINGSNGVGKSSLFMDAMLDALYEGAARGRADGGGFATTRRPGAGPSSSPSSWATAFTASPEPGRKRKGHVEHLGERRGRLGRPQQGEVQGHAAGNHQHRRNGQPDAKSLRPYHARTSTASFCRPTKRPA